MTLRIISQYQIKNKMLRNTTLDFNRLTNETLTEQIDQLCIFYIFQFYYLDTRLVFSRQITYFQ